MFEKTRFRKGNSPVETPLERTVEVPIEPLVDPSLLEDNTHTPTDPSPITYPPLEEMHYQRSMNDFIDRLITENAPEGVTDRLKALIHLHLQSYAAILMNSNYEAYETLRLTESAHAPHIQAILERAEVSKASPVELLTLNTQTEIRSVELKKLTHPFGLRSEYLQDMNDEVTGAIAELGGEVFSDGQSTEVNILRYHYDTDGFIVTTRELVGKVDDVLIKKRRTFVMNVNSPHFDPALRRLIKTVDRNQPLDIWFAQVVKDTGLADYTAQALLDPDRPSGLHGLSTMIYSFNPDRKRPKERLEKKAVIGLQLARQAIQSQE